MARAWLETVKNIFDDRAVGKLCHGCGSWWSPTVESCPKCDGEDD